MKYLMLALLSLCSLSTLASIYCNDNSQTIILATNGDSSYDLQMTTPGAKVIFSELAYKGGRHTYTFTNDEIKFVIRENFETGVAEGSLFYSENQALNGFRCCSEGNPLFYPTCGN